MKAASPDKHIVFGAGLIGGYVAGGLLNAGLDTYVVARENVQRKLAHGLLITDYLDNKAKVGAPKFVDPRQAEPPCADVLWLTVKCTAVESAMDEVAKLVDADTIIICCQNGFGSDQAVRTSFPDNKIVGAVVGYNVAEPKDAHLHRSTEGKLVVENTTDIAELIAHLDTAVFPCTLSDNFLADQWAKLQLNLANPVNALADIPVKSMLEQRDYRRVIAELQRELLAVCKGLKIDLPKLTALPAAWLPVALDVPDFVFKLLGQKMLMIDPTARASTWWDLEHGKKTEIDYLNQAVVNAAQDLGIVAPFNHRIVELIHQVENEERQKGIDAPALWQLLSRA